MCIGGMGSRAGCVAGRCGSRIWRAEFVLVSDVPGGLSAMLLVALPG